MITVLEGCHVATVDASGTEHTDGYVAIEDGVITAVGAGRYAGDGVRVEATGLLVTPGFVNSHHHLYQWITRGYATDDTLFGWLTTLYPIWARLDADLVHDAAAANLAWMALTGCTTTMDHHYVFPHGQGDLLEAEILAAREIGLRFHPTRGSMNLGESDGGLPPDSVVEQHDAILAASSDAIDRWHDPSPGAMVRIALAPCSPFSVTADLMRDSAALAREKGVRLHTHLAETQDEEAFCLETFGRTPTQYAEDLGWLGDDVWMAHCVHMSDDAVARFAATGTGVAHCPTSNGRLGSGIAPIRALLDAGAPVGLGVDGSASNESGRMIDELHQAMLAARYRGGPLALSARDALRMATMGGARCLGRDAELGSIEVGKQADLALWRVGELPGAGIEDPLTTLVFGAPTLEHLFVGGRAIVSGGALTTVDAGELAVRAAAASARIAGALMDLICVEDLVPARGAAWRPGDAFLAGGSWLFSEPQPGVTRLLDLESFGWAPLVESEAGLEIAATCTLAQLHAWTPPAAWPAGLLARRCCDALLGSFKVHNTATVGGNICLALPAGPMTSLAASLGGIATLWSPDGTVRELPVTELVTGVRQTALRPGELLRSVLLPAASLAARAAMRQYSLTELGRSAALVVGLLVPSGDIVVTVTASTPRPVQVTVRPTVDDAAATLEAAVPAWHDDVHGDPAWRAALTRRLVAEVVSELLP